MIQSITISVYDVTIPDIYQQNILDYAQKDSIVLTYNGSDDKNTNILTSQLDFSLEVSIDQSSDVFKYDYLFTGEEFRYKVVVTDQINDIIWSGFLLPDQYQEPFTTGTFFVNVTATDGLGLLRGNTLKDTFYSGKNSIIKCIADSLQKTDLSLDIYVDPAVINKGAGRDWRALFISAADLWADDEGNASCFDIIEDCLKVMACTLYQQKNSWYIMGHNRRAYNTNVVYKYNSLGELISPSYILVNPGNTISMFNVPLLSLKPPFKKVEVAMEINEENQIFPSNLVRQPVKIISDFNTLPFLSPQYFKGNGPGLVSLLLVLDDKYPVFNGEDIDLYWNVGFLSFGVGLQLYPEALNYYISLKNPVFLKAGLILDIELEIDSHWFDDDGDNDIDNDINNDLLMYEFLINGSAIISNKRGFPKRDQFLMDFNNTRRSNGKNITTVSSVKIEGFEVLESGFLDFRQYYGVGMYGNSPSQVFIKKLEVNSVQQKKKYIKSRNLKRSNKIQFDNKILDSVLDLNKNAILYQKYIEKSEFNTVFFNTTYLRGSGPVAVGDVLILLSDDYNYLNTYKDRIYFKRNGTDFFEYVNDFEFLEQGGLFLMKIHFKDNYIVSVLDSLFVRPLVGGDPLRYNEFLNRELWAKAIDANGYKSLAYTLAEVQHDIYSSALVSMECTARGLIFPYDLITYELQNENRNFIPLRMKIFPERNQTDLYLLEQKNNNVNDYE